MKSFNAPVTGVGAVVFHNKQVLLVRRRNAPSQGQWAIPGGKLRFGETLQEGAEREVLEETGIRIRADEPVFAFDVIERDTNGEPALHYVVVDLAATYIDGTPVGTDDASDARWFSAEELDKFPVNKTTRKLLSRYADFEWHRQNSI